MNQAGSINRGFSIKSPGCSSLSALGLQDNFWNSLLIAKQFSYRTWILRKQCVWLSQAQPAKTFCSNNDRTGGRSVPYSTCSLAEYLFLAQKHCRENYRDPRIHWEFFSLQAPVYSASPAIFSSPLCSVFLSSTSFKIFPQEKSCTDCLYQSSHRLSNLFLFPPPLSFLASPQGAL